MLRMQAIKIGMYVPTRTPTRYIPSTDTPFFECTCFKDFNISVETKIIVFVPFGACLKEFHLVLGGGLASLRIY